MPFIVIQATPRLSEDKVKQCVDPKLKGEYPPKSVAKVLHIYPTSILMDLVFLIARFSSESNETMMW